MKVVSSYDVRVTEELQVIKGAAMKSVIRSTIVLAIMICFSSCSKLETFKPDEYLYCTVEEVVEVRAQNQECVDKGRGTANSCFNAAMSRNCNRLSVPGEVWVIENDMQPTYYPPKLELTPKPAEAPSCVPCEQTWISSFGNWLFAFACLAVIFVAGHYFFTKRN